MAAGRKTWEKSESEPRRGERKQPNRQSNGDPQEPELPECRGSNEMIVPPPAKHPLAKGEERVPIHESITAGVGVELAVSNVQKDVIAKASPKQEEYIEYNVSTEKDVEGLCAHSESS